MTILSFFWRRFKSNADLPLLFSRSEGWSCRPFQMSSLTFQTGAYYILVILEPFSSTAIHDNEDDNNSFHNLNRTEEDVGCVISDLHNVKQGGIRGCYRGLMPQALRDIKASGLYFLIYEVTQLSHIWALASKCDASKCSEPSIRWTWRVLGAEKAREVDGLLSGLEALQGCSPGRFDIYLLKLS